MSLAIVQMSIRFIYTKKQLSVQVNFYITQLPTNTVPLININLLDRYIIASRSVLATKVGQLSSEWDKSGTF